MVPVHRRDELLKAFREGGEVAKALGGGWIWWLTAVKVKGGEWPCLVLEGEAEDAKALRPLWAVAMPVINPEWGPVLDEDRDSKIMGRSALIGRWPPEEQALEEAVGVLLEGVDRPVWQAPDDLLERL